MSLIVPNAPPPALVQVDPSLPVVQNHAQPSAAANQCVNEPTFQQCMGNYLADGGIASCNSLPKTSDTYNQCLCKQYFTQTYCYNVFCPSDPTVPQLRNLQAQYCSLVPNFTPNPTGNGVVSVGGLDALPSGSTTTLLLTLPKNSLAHHGINAARFSDIDLTFGSRTFKLHRIVLVQSKFFDLLFAGKSTITSCSYELDVAGSTATLDLQESSVSPDALTIALRDLYATCQRSKLITRENIFSVLLAACFLQTQDLISYCTQTILSTLSKTTIATYCCHIDTILSNNGRLINVATNRDFLRLRNLSRDVLLPHIESFLCHTINTAITAPNSLNPATESTSNILEAAESHLFELFAELPLTWFKFVIDSPSLAVHDEFTRYQLLKRAAVYRWRKISSCPSTTEDGSGIKRVTTIGNKKMSAFFGSLFTTNSTPSSPIPMKCDEKWKQQHSTGQEASSTHSPKVPNSLRGSVASFESSVFSSVYGGPSNNNNNGVPQSTSCLSRLVNLYSQEYLKTNDSSPRDEEILILHMFETSIVYTYMSFAQLEKVKADKIVSDSAVLNSFWMQAELINRFTTPFQQIGGGGGFPGVVGPFRFSVCVKGLYGFVMDHMEGISKGEKCVVASEGVKCAGIDYRVLVAVEVDEKYERKEGDLGSSSTVMSKPPSLFRMNRSKSLDDLKQKSGAGGKDGGVLQGLEDDLVSRKFLLKATLQRNRTHGVYGGNGGSSQGGASQRVGNAAPPISYSIYLSDASNFNNGATLVQKPVTMCDFDGTGFVKGFSVPKSGNSCSADGASKTNNSAVVSTTAAAHPKNLIGTSASMSRMGSQTSILQEKLKKVRDSFTSRASTTSVNSGSISRKNHGLRVSGAGSSGKDGEGIWLAVNIKLFEN
ncbi:UNVERIFIED_CONTAM: hypothetical protein HDU68_010027 [Siphonaria sp. JEL0065]|nr:hypothetical protein HDU68_010027 [Siphonaria sp. JEL0065]